MDITILDSGYLTRDREGSQKAVADRAGYDGSSAVTAFTLKVSSINEVTGTGIDDNPVPGSTGNAEINFVTTENPKYTLSLLIDKSDATSGFDKSQLYQLRRLAQTDGVKLIYPSATTDTYKSIVELNGAANTSGVFQGSGKELPASTPYLVGRIISVTVTDTANQQYFNINIKFIEE